MSARELCQKPANKLRLVLIILLFSASGALAQRIVAIPAQKLPFAFKNYYFTDVLDSRPTTTNVGAVLENGQSVTLQLQNGLTKTLSEWARANPKIDTSRIAIRIRIETCKLTEQKKTDGSIEGKLALTLVFERPHDDDAVFLVRLSGGGTFKRTATVTNMAETMLRRSFESIFANFNRWFTESYGQDHNLVKGIQLVVLPDYARPEAARDDTIFYASKRPIAWNDFQAGVHFGSKYAAAIYSSFSYEGKSSVRPDGYLQVEFQLKTFMIKSSSWTKHTDETPYALAHEQLHFDLTHLTALKFKAKVISMDLDWADYDSQIQYQYLDFFRDMNRVQLLYDAETNHSLVPQQQARWAKQIAAELARYGSGKGITDDKE